MDLGLFGYRRANLPCCRWIAAAGLALFSLLPPTARAAPIEFHYGGVITSADDGTGVTPGTRFDGTFTYDPQTIPLAMVIEDANFYTFGTSGTWLTASPPPDTSAINLSVGDKSMFSRQGGLGVGVSEIQDNHPFNPYPHTNLNINSHDLVHNVTINLDLINPDRGVLGSLDLPATINLADFPQATLTVTGWGATPGTSLSYRGTIDTLAKVEQATTPEPASVALWLGLAAAAWVVKARSPGRA